MNVRCKYCKEEFIACEALRDDNGNYCCPYCMNILNHDQFPLYCPHKCLEAMENIDHDGDFTFFECPKCQHTLQVGTQEFNKRMQNTIGVERTVEIEKAQKEREHEVHQIWEETLPKVKKELGDK